MDQTKVRLINLTGNTALNGLCGTRTSWNIETERYVVVLDVGEFQYGTYTCKRLKVRPTNLQLLPLPKPNDGTIALSHLKCYSTTLDNLKQDRKERLDDIPPEHRHFDNVMCPVCNVKPVQKTCNGCKRRRYCSRGCECVLSSFFFSINSDFHVLSYTISHLYSKLVYPVVYIHVYIYIPCGMLIHVCRSKKRMESTQNGMQNTQIR